MRVAAIYDIHGNAPALEAVLRELDAVQPDAIVVGGDVAAGPLPRETLDLLRRLGSTARFVRGNADRELVACFDGTQPTGPTPGPADPWVVARLSQEDRDLLAGFEERIVLDVDGLGRTLFCHGSPRGDEEIVTRATGDDRLGRIFADVREPAVVCGHTHVQFDRVVDGRRVVNAGSVGMPYEAAPGAYWLLLGPVVELRRTAYDVERAAERIRGTSWPQAEEFASENVVRVPSAEEATELFERMALEREAG